MITVDQPAWMGDALCAQTDPEGHFPEKGGSSREAKKTCLSCEVREECLEYALSNDERFGVWGGLSEYQRRKVREQRAKDAGPQVRVCALTECEELLPEGAPKYRKYCCDLHAHRAAARAAHARRPWRELVTTHWRDAHDQWLIQRERECSGWSVEEAEYAAKHPRPTLKAFMVGLASGAIEPGAAA